MDEIWEARGGSISKMSSIIVFVMTVITLKKCSLDLSAAIGVVTEFSKGCVRSQEIVPHCGRTALVM